MPLDVRHELTFLCHVLQIPRYIITIHELLAHTPHDHVERRSLEFAQSKLEELSQASIDRLIRTAGCSIVINKIHLNLIY